MKISKKILINICIILLTIYFIFLFKKFYFENPLTIKVSFDDYFGQFNAFVGFNFEIILALLTGLWIIFVSFLIGRIFLKKRLKNAFSPSEITLFSTALGMFVLGMVTFFIGLAGYVNKYLIFSIFIILTIALFPYKEIRNLSKLKDILKNTFDSFKELSIINKILILIIFLIMLVGLINALTPPYQSDGIRYHLTGPQEYIKAGKISYIPLNANSNFPFLIEMLFLDGMIIGGDICPTVIHFLILILLMWGIFNFWKYHIEPKLNNKKRNSILDSLLIFNLITTPGAVIVASWPFIDIGMTFFLFLAIYLFIVWVEKRDAKSLVLCAVFSGVALGTKYTLLAFVFMMCVIAFIISFIDEKRNLKNRLSIALKNSIILGLLSIALASPWFIKNYAFTGNPTYPMLYKIFDGKEWSQQNEDFYMSKVKEKGFGTSIKSFAELPYNTAFQWQKFGSFNIGILFCFMSILFLIHFLYALITYKKNRTVILLYLLSLFYILIWFFTYQDNRLLIPILPILIILLNVIFFELRKNAYELYKLILTFVIIIGIYNSLWIARYMLIDLNPIPYVSGFESKDDFLSKRLSHYDIFRYLNQKVKDEEKVLFIGEHRGYYCDVNYLASDWFDTPYILHLIRQFDTNEKLFGYLKGNKINYVFYNKSELGMYSNFYYKPRFSEDEWARYLNFMSSDKIKIIYQNKEMFVFEIR